MPQLSPYRSAGMRLNIKAEEVSGGELVDVGSTHAEGRRSARCRCVSRVVPEGGCGPVGVTGDVYDLFRQEMYTNAIAQVDATTHIDSHVHSVRNDPHQFKCTSMLNFE